MARFNEILTGRINRALQKFTGIKGAAPTPQLATEVIPVIPLFWGPEARYLEQWVIHSSVSNIAASAAQLNAVMLRNPVGSNVIAVFTKITISSGTGFDACILSLGPRTTDLPTPSTLAAPSNFDRRFGAVSSSALIRSIQQSAGPGTAPPDRGIWSYPVNTTYDVINDSDQQFPLLPGDAVSIRNSIVNQQTIFSLWWRERALEDSELF